MIIGTKCLYFGRVVVYLRDENGQALIQKQDARQPQWVNIWALKDIIK